MAGTSERLGDRALRLVGVQTALVSAAAHLLWMLSADTDVFGDVRIPLFAAVIVVLVAGSAAVFRGFHHRRDAELPFEAEPDIDQDGDQGE